jgi:uncharacterized integral membrane protein (TIGR00698 family)
MYLSQLLSPQWTLILGMILSFMISNNSIIKIKAKKWSSKVLQVSVVFLGANLNLNSVMSLGFRAIFLTLIIICMVFLAGWAINKFAKIELSLWQLLTSGTAICGGSAIGAIAPIIKASSLHLATAMSIIFLLNSVAIYLFPWLGQLLNLTQTQFGFWAALAIHDTSSVVAASNVYGTQALATATTVKLMRALAIIPLSLLFSYRLGRNQEVRGAGVNIPWFIIGFILMSLLFSYFSADVVMLKKYFSFAAKMGFAITLFLIGVSLNFNQIKQIGAMPLIYSVLLWLFVSVFSLFLIFKFL